MLDEIRAVVCDDRPLEHLLAGASPRTAAILDRAVARTPLSEEDGEHLLTVHGHDLTALVRTADHIREADVGPAVTYVVNRNINFTNICFVGCQFCGFARHRKDADAYRHSIPAILDKVREAVLNGATEICMQGGINPDIDDVAYRELIVAIKREFPRVHLHAFSPMEIMYGARRAGRNYRDYLADLQAAGLDTIPGTAAEILDDEVRQVLSHKKVPVHAWVEIVTAAHRLGIRSSATMMYGHIETPRHAARHVALLRSIQRDTGGFTEFVPLRFIHDLTQLYQRGTVGEPPPKGLVDLRMYAFSRLMLRGAIDNIQTSWVKLGPELAQLTLRAGCNDFGGTLMEEAITKSAGGDSGEYLPAADIAALIAGIGRSPVERTTTYGKVPATNATRSGDGSGWRSRSGSVSPRPLPAH